MGSAYVGSKTLFSVSGSGLNDNRQNDEKLFSLCSHLSSIHCWSAIMKSFG